MAVNINITPTIPNIIVSDNPSLITPDLSNYTTLSTLDFTSGILNESIIRSGSYLYNLINTSAAGVSSLNGSSGILLLKGTGSVYVTTNGQTITISGDGGNSQSVNLVGLISTGSADLRYYAISNPSQYIKSGEVNGIFVLKSETGNFISANQTGQFYPVSNPNNFLRSGDVTQSNASGLATSGNLETTGTLLQNQIFNISNNTGNFITSNNLMGFISTGASDLRYYPLSSNPSNFITGFNSGIYITTGQTGQFYPYNNPLQFSSSGNVALTGAAIINLLGNYYLISNPAQYIKSGEIIGIYVLKSDTGNFISSNNLNGLISSGSANLTYLQTGVSGFWYPISNPNQFATSGYVNFISGLLASQGGGGGSGIQSLNSLAGAINLISSTDSFIFNNTGNNINIWDKEQSSEIYRNVSGQITGVKYNADFSRIYRNPNDKITGIFYNNYFKRILYDINDSVTGVNVIYY